MHDELVLWEQKKTEKTLDFFNEIDADLYFNELKNKICHEIISNSKDYVLGVDKTD